MKKPDPQRTRTAIMVLARQRAKNAVIAQLRAKGLKFGQFSAREVSELADDYFAQHRERLINDAAQVIATSPLFARWRCAEVINSVQTEDPCNYSEIPVQKSGAEWRAKQ